jgi:hypothetical protein
LLTADLDVSTTMADTGFSTRERIGLASDSEYIDFVMALSVNSDNLYGADIANFRNTKSLFDVYSLMEVGYTALQFQPLQFQVGRLKHQDAFASMKTRFFATKVAGFASTTVLLWGLTLHRLGIR